MPLVTTEIPAQDVLEGVNFAMKDGDTIIPVAVSHAALQDIKSPPYTGPDYADFFEGYRPTFEAIARKKYKNDKKIIFIGSSDLLDNQVR